MANVTSALARQDNPPHPPTREPPPRARKALPPGRTLEQLWNHFQVEKSFAEQLKRADRVARRAIYGRMYDELFERVRDHPRLTRRTDAARTLKASREKWRLIGPLLDARMAVCEIGPGDCLFLGKIAACVRVAYGLDISDQRPAGCPLPDNLRLVVYDGYDTREIPDGSLDFVFSDQLIEHLHPEDTFDHFRLVRRLLKPGGKYLFRTPHAMNGPHDVSAYFSDEPLGFHLKEWTYGELDGLLAQTGFRSAKKFWAARGLRIALPSVYFRGCEALLRHVPKRAGRQAARLLVPTIEVVAEA